MILATKMKLSDLPITDSALLTHQPKASVLLPHLIPTALRGDQEFISLPSGSREHLGLD